MVNIKKINDRMDELKITKAQLIKNSGLTRVTVDKVFKGGNINVDTLEALAKGLGVNVGFFFDDKVEDVANTQTGNGVQQNAGRDANYSGLNMEEHDELIRLREENKHLKATLKDKEDEIRENRKLINHFIGMS